MSAYPTRAQFAEQTGTPLSAAIGDATVELVLDSVREGQSSDGHESFSLEFTAAGDRPFPQATYSLAHEVLGTHDIFLVPIASDGATTRYEAVFNLAKESEG